MSCKIWMIRGSPRTPDRLPGLSGSRVQQSKVFRTVIGTCGPYNLGGSATFIGIRMTAVNRFLGYKMLYTRSIVAMSKLLEI